jgi:NADH-quinone oxidoreductase subunit A
VALKIIGSSPIIHLIMFIMDYVQILMFMVFSILLASVLLVLGLYLSPTMTDFEKLSAYECGFMPIGDARQPFHVRFYLVGILFLLFDLEVVFLFPGVLYLNSVLLCWQYIVIVCGFMAFLVLGFAYECLKGALSWE